MSKEVYRDWKEAQWREGESGYAKDLDQFAARQYVTVEKYEQLCAELEEAKRYVEYWKNKFELADKMYWEQRGDENKFVLAFLERHANEIRRRM